MGMLSELMMKIDVQSFYGKISFNPDGSIKKPMYVQQYQSKTLPALPMSPVFTTMYGNMDFPLNECMGWAPEPVPTTCDTVKSLYKTNTCCGMPDKVVDMSAMTQTTVR